MATTFRSAGALLFAVALVGCKGDRFANDIPDEIALRGFDNCDDLRDYAGDVILEQLIQNRYGTWGWFGGVDDGAAEGDAGGNDGPSDYTTTNVQEQGVDEVDRVKTDGEYLYIVEDDQLYVVTSWPAEDAELIGQVTVGDYPHGLFLDGDQAVVFSYYYTDQPWNDRSWGGTRVSWVDLSDRSDPEITRTLDVEGWFADARLIDRDAYMVLNTWLPIPDGAWELIWDDDLDLPEMEWEASETRQEFIRNQARQILKPHVDALVAGLDQEDLTPLFVDSDTASSVPEPLLECDDVYRPAEVSHLSMMSIVHLDLASGDVDSTGVMSDGWTIYASRDNLYVAQTSWWWWWGWGSMDLDTHIHKFRLGDGAPDYMAAGKVDGWLLSQWSMSEYDGHLRVASTETDWWWGTGTDQGGNHVTVLEDDNGHLVEVGSVRDIAPGEQIRGVRMMADKAYVVTFEQIDPLFTIDLSDPTDPELVGELEMPGFSAYMHPVGDDNLLAVGMSGTWDGQLTGLAVTMFDVSDFSQPAIAHQYTLEADDWAWSESLWDHHAFTYHRDVLSIPIYTYDYDESTGGWDWFSGMLVLKATPEGIVELGRIDHRDLVAQSECRYEWGCDDYYWYAWMRRSVYVEDNLFSISDYGVKVNDLNDPSIEEASVLFRPLNP